MLNQRLPRFLVHVVLMAIGSHMRGPLMKACAAEPARPNVVFIVADDLGALDCGPFGNPRVGTPHLDQLAASGMRFTRAFLTCSSCSPSRTSMITGRYPHATGAAELHQPVPESQHAFTEALRDAGYWTAAAGKWHLGPAMKTRFDVVHEGGGASGCEQWIATLRERPRDKPFFVWLASFDPHRGYQAGAVARPHQPSDAVLPPYHPDTPEVRADYALYYDEIARLDGYVGQVLDELKQQGVDQNTLVIFNTDNGRPFPRCKTTVYDSGVQTPLIVRWPNRIVAGTTCDRLVSSVDLAPTIVEACGGKQLPSFQGRSFANLLVEPQAAGREYVFAEHNWHDFLAHQRAVRDGRYKYIWNARPDVPQTPPADAVRSDTFQTMRKLRDDGNLTAAQSTVFAKPAPVEELYDTQADPHELKNLVDDPAQAATLARLRSVLDQWKAETADRVPETLTPDKYDRETGEPLEKPKKPRGKVS
jgi:arylsulfatase A-like enzyme